MKEKFDVYYESEEFETMSLDDIFYLIKNYRLIEITLSNGYVIRQWKDLPTQYVIDGETYDMEYGKVYCTSGNKVIESVWNGWGVDELKDYIETCSQYI